MITTKDIHESYARCSQVAIRLFGQEKLPKIKLAINPRFSTRTVGRCRIRASVDYVLLEFNPNMKREHLDTTMVHELAHAICGIKEGHGYLWKRTAKKMGDIVGVDVSRTTQGSLSLTQARYVITCQKCGTQAYKNTKTNVVRYPEFYQCKCGGNLKVTTQ